MWTRNLLFCFFLFGRTFLVVEMLFGGGSGVDDLFEFLISIVAAFFEIGIR